MISAVQLSVALWIVSHSPCCISRPFLTSIPPSILSCLSHAGNYVTLCRAVRREEWRENCVYIVYIVCVCLCVSMCVSVCVMGGRWMEKEREIRVDMRAKERKAWRDLSSFINLSFCLPPSFIIPIRCHTSSILSLLFHQGRGQGRSSHIFWDVIGCRSRVGP